MNNLQKNFIFLCSVGIYLVFFLVILVIFRNWFNGSLITAGDFWPHYPEQFLFLSLRPYAWNTQVGSGLGGNAFFSFWNYLFFTYPLVFYGKFLHFSFPVVERLSFLFPLLILASISSYLWAKAFFKNPWIITFSMLIFVFNTYALMIVGGGQMGIIYAYLFSPIALLSLIKLNTVSGERVVWKNIIFSGLLLGILIEFDLRIAYILFLGFFLYWILSYFAQTVNSSKFISIQNLLVSFVSCFLIPGIIAVLLHSYWIFPTLLSHTNPVAAVGKAYNSTSAAVFFSFATFENAFSLLHPNWPENIFGKVYFMRWEFIILPILAYSSLLFLNKKTKNSFFILFLSFLGLISTFIAKGANQPFGEIFLWCFTHVPGFIMFRDASKFYLFISLSYAILIPWTIQEILPLLHIRSNKKQIIFVIVGIIIFLSIVIPKTLISTNGIFLTTTIPDEYIRFKNVLVSEEKFSRTLWIPQQQRFGYYSPTHPLIDASTVFDKTNTNDIVKILQGKNPSYPNPDQLLTRWGVKYVVVPYDSEKEIFLDDRKYSDKKRQQLINRLDTISYLTKDTTFKNLTIYKLSNHKERFFVDDASSANITKNTIVDTTEYIVNVDVKRPSDIIFSQTYDPGWYLEKGNTVISTKQTNDNLNSFFITKSGEYTVKYSPQAYVDFFFIITILTAIGCIGVLFYLRENGERYLPSGLLERE